MSLSRFATTHIKAILFVTVALCAVGAWLTTSFPVSILPDVSFPRVVAIAEAGERSSRVMEVGVTRPLEEAIATVPGVSRIRSKTQRGASEISIDFAWGTDIVLAQQLVNTRVNEARSQLPPETHVSVERMNPTVFPIMGISLHSSSLSQSDLWALATYTLRPRLARVPGVARVVVQGGRVPEIAVEVDPRRLTAYHLALADVEQALAQSNVVQAVGRLDLSFQTYEALVSGEVTSLDQIGRVVVAQRAGAPIFLSQVATVSPSVEDRTTIVSSDGAEAVLLNVVRQPDANTVSVTEAIRREMARLNLPPGTTMSVFYDQSTLINEAVTSVRDAVLIGALLSVFVLLLFLGDLRATLVTAAIIPATLLITFLLMRLAGLTLNLMTLGALAVGIGLVVDDAIVVVENVFRHLGGGEPRSEAVRRAANEIAAPMISSTVTTVVVFLPLVLLGGVEGAFFTALAVTLTIALLVSLALALLVSPSLCAAFLRERGEHEEHGRLFARFVRLYERLLRASLRSPWLAVAAAAAVLIVTALLARGLKSGFMPEMDEGSFILDYWTPPGTSLAESDRLVHKIEDILRETKEVETFSRRTGTEMGFFVTEPNRGDISVVLKPRRGRTIDQVMDDIRDKISEEVPGVEKEFVQVLQDLIGDLAGNPEPIEVKLFGENQGQLEATAKAIAERLEKVGGLADVKTGVVETGPELVLRVDPARAGRAGMTTQSVAEQAGGALLGEVATRVLQGDRQVGVRVRYPAWYRSDRTRLASLPIRTPAGFTVPLGSIGSVESVAGAVEINREDQRRMVAVTARLNQRDLGSAMRDIAGVMRSTPLPAGVGYVLGGQYQSQQQFFRSASLVMALAMLLVFAVMLFQFGSFTAPTVVMLVMPLSLFGVVAGLLITGAALNVSSAMGAIMLVGIVVKNGILLLDRAQRFELEGCPPDEAVARAGHLRLRPILMTTLTALLGLVPLALGIGAGAEMQQPLAIAVIGGLSCSTLFTLLLAPVLYVLLRRWQLRLRV